MTEAFSGVPRGTTIRQEGPPRAVRPGAGSIVMSSPSAAYGPRDRAAIPERWSNVRTWIRPHGHWLGSGPRRVARSCTAVSIARRRITSLVSGVPAVRTSSNHGEFGTNLTSRSRTSGYGIIRSEAFARAHSSPNVSWMNALKNVYQIEAPDRSVSIRKSQRWRTCSEAVHSADVHPAARTNGTKIWAAASEVFP